MHHDKARKKHNKNKNVLLFLPKINKYEKKILLKIKTQRKQKDKEIKKKTKTCI